jgi:hypothetical protein
MAFMSGAPVATSPLASPLAMAGRDKLKTRQRLSAMDSSFFMGLLLYKR